MYNILSKSKEIINFKQECIPVGCLPPAAVAVGGGWEVCLSACWDTPPGVGLETPPGVGLENTPWVWAWRTPLARPLKLPLGCGPGNLQGMLGYTCPPPPRPARHAGISPARHAGIPPPRGQTDTCKNITFANFVCWR